MRNSVVSPCTSAVAALVFTATIGTSAANAQEAQPNSVSYVVKQGDTLIGLSHRFMVGERSANEVQRLNRIADPNRLPVGKRLVIPRRLLRSTPINLTLQSFSGPVTIVAGGQRVAARAGAPLAEGSMVETGANGFASVVASDGSRISLPTNSLARFGMSRRYVIDRSADIDVEIMRGRSEVHAAPQNPGGNFRVRTPVAVSAVRGTEFRVGVAEGGERGFTEVLGGLVGVATPARQIAVEPGFGAASDKSGDIARETLLAAPALLEPGKVQTDAEVSFHLTAVPGAAGYNVELAKDAGFVDVIAESGSETVDVVFRNIPNGRYYARTSARARSGLVGLNEAWSIRRQRVGLSAEAGPGSDPDAFRFAWSAQGEGHSLYRFQLFGADRSAPMIDEPGLDTTSINLTGLKPGAYHWRVGVIQTGPDGSAEVWMPLQRINISG